MLFSNSELEAKTTHICQKRTCANVFMFYVHVFQDLLQTTLVYEFANLYIQSEEKNKK